MSFVILSNLVIFLLSDQYRTKCLLLSGQSLEVVDLLCAIFGHSNWLLLHFKFALLRVEKVTLGLFLPVLRVLCIGKRHAELLRILLNL